MKKWLVLTLIFFWIKSLAGLSTGLFLTENADPIMTGLGNAVILNYIDYSRYIKVAHINKWGTIYYENLKAHCKFNRIGITGADILFVHQEEFKVYDAIGNIKSSESIYDLAFGIYWAKEVLKDIKAGIEVKYIRSKVLEYTGNAMALDFFLLYQKIKHIDINLEVKNVSYGMRYSYEKSKRQSLPVEFACGINFNNLFLNGLNLYTQFRYIIYEYYLTGAGVEYKIKNISLRAGYCYSNEVEIANITGGCGVNFKNFGIDYSYIPAGILGHIHKFSIKYTMKQEGIPEQVSNNKK